MQLIKVEKTFNVSASEVFAMLEDHARYDRFPGVHGAELLHAAGGKEKNGVGALRWVDLGLTKMSEEIVGFERDRLLEYRVVKSQPMPFEHKLGRVVIEAQGDNQCHVVWTSEYTIPVPVIGGMLAKMLLPRFTSGLKVVLSYIERKTATAREIEAKAAA